MDLPGYSEYVEIKPYVNRVYPTPVRSTMASSHMQQRSSGAARRARCRVTAGLVVNSKTSGDGCFQFSGHRHPRLWWIFVQLTLHRGGSRGCRCTVGDNRHATKYSNPPEPCVPIRTRITAADSTLNSAALALICEQDIYDIADSVRSGLWLLHDAAASKAAGGWRARSQQASDTLLYVHARLNMPLVVRSREHRHSIVKECMHGT